MQYSFAEEGIFPPSSPQRILSADVHLKSGSGSSKNVPTVPNMAGLFDDQSLQWNCVADPSGAVPVHTNRSSPGSPKPNGPTEIGLIMEPSVRSVQSLATGVRSGKRYQVVACVKRFSAAPFCVLSDSHALNVRPATKEKATPDSASQISSAANRLVKSVPGAYSDAVKKMNLGSGHPSDVGGSTPVALQRSHSAVGMSAQSQAALLAFHLSI